MKKTRDPRVAAIRQRNMAARAKRNPESVKPKELEKAHEEAVQPKGIVKKELDQWLDDVDYSFLNSNEYMPSQFALQFANFIKLVNGDTPESHKTPPMHLAMLDKLASDSQYIVNLCFRGAAKTSVFMEYMTLYIAVFHELPYLGDISGMIYVADSMENGAKNARKNIETRYSNSAFLQEWIPSAKFTDTYLEFENKAGQKLGVKLFGATTGIRGTKIFAKRPTLCHKKGTLVCTDKGWHKVEDYYKQGPSRKEYGYTVSLFGLLEPEVVTSEHRYMCAKQIRKRNKYYLPDGTTNSTTDYYYEEPKWVEAKDLVPREKLGNQRTAISYLVSKIDNEEFPVEAIPHYKQSISERNEKGQIVRSKHYLEYEVHEPMYKDAWWWIYGYYLSNGHTCKNKVGFTIPLKGRDVVGKKLQQCCNQVGYILGSESIRPGCYQMCICDAPLSRFLAENHLGNGIKNIPEWVLKISKEKQRQLLLGYIAGDGYIDSKHNQIRINSVNPDAIRKLGIICARLELPYHIRNTRTKEFEAVFPNGQVCISHKQTEIRLSQGVREILGIDIDPLPSDQVFIKDGYLYRKVQSVVQNTTKDEFIPIETPDHIYQTEFGISHNCILDDLISDEASKSKTVMQLIRDTVYKGINHALDPVNRKVIFNGTPFNKDDVLLEAVESGAWEVNVWPVCEKFPVEEKDFKPAWPDRFSYKYIKSQYDMAVNTGQINAFNQELMLRITSEEDRLIQDSEIKWFCRQDLLQNRQNFNFYITTDFATSSKQTADDSVISVWAYNANGDWFWVDGICAKQSMDKTVDDLFRFVLLYKPQEVGIEVTGQQGAFISWLQKEQLTRNIWFNFAKNPGSKSPGIRPTVDKLSRLNMVVPWFKMGKVFFPEEMKSSTIIGTFMQEIKLATRSGLKGHDDCLDTISMLAFLNPWKPQESMLVNAEGRTIYEDYPELDPGYMRNDSPMDSYMV